MRLALMKRTIRTNWLKKVTNDAEAHKVYLNPVYTPYITVLNPFKF